MSFDKKTPETKWYLRYKMTSFLYKTRDIKIRQNDDNSVLVSIDQNTWKGLAKLLITPNLNYPVPISIADKCNKNVLLLILKYIESDVIQKRIVEWVLVLSGICYYCCWFRQLRDF